LVRKTDSIVARAKGQAPKTKGGGSKTSHFYSSSFPQ
jgi:hypothetical protein